MAGGKERGGTTVQNECVIIQLKKVSKRNLQCMFDEDSYVRITIPLRMDRIHGTCSFSPIPPILVISVPEGIVDHSCALKWRENGVETNIKEKIYSK